MLVTWEGKCHHYKSPPFLLLLPAFTAKHNTLWCEYPHGHLGSAVPTVSPPKLLCALSRVVVRNSELHKHCSEQIKHPCVLNTVFITNPKHSTIGAAVNKINSILSKTNPKSVYSPYTVLGIYLFAYPHLAVLELTGRSIYPKH